MVVVVDGFIGHTWSLPPCYVGSGYNLVMSAWKAKEGSKKKKKKKRKTCPKKQKEGSRISA